MANVVATKSSFWATPIGIWVMGAVMTLLNALLMYVQTNNVGTAVVDTVTSATKEVTETVEDSKVEVKKEVRKSEADVIKEAEQVADALAPVNEIIEGWGQNQQAAPVADPSRIQLLKPEDKAKILKALALLESIERHVAAIDERGPSEPLEPQAAPEDYPPDPEPVAEGGPPQVPQEPGAWTPKAR